MRDFAHNPEVDPDNSSVNLRLLHKSEMCEIQVIFYFDRQVASRFVEASQNCVYNSTTLPKATCTDRTRPIKVGSMFRLFL